MYLQLVMLYSTNVNSEKSNKLIFIKRIANSLLKTYSVEKMQV